MGELKIEHYRERQMMRGARGKKINRNKKKPQAPERCG